MPQADIDTGTARPLPGLRRRVAQQLSAIYNGGDIDAGMEGLAGEILDIMRLQHWLPQPEAYINHWDQRNALMITYGDSIIRDGEKPLQTLKHWFDRHADGLLTGMHILPFCPWSSDDGFAVIDYLKVNEPLGDWDDVLAIGLSGGAGDGQGRTRDVVTDAKSQS